MAAPLVAAKRKSRERTAARASRSEGKAAETGEEMVGVNRPDHWARLGFVEGDSAEGHVLEGLDEDAAESKHDEWAEDGIALHARMVSTPPVIIGATRQPSIAASGRAARQAATISSKAVSAAARSVTPKGTPPISLLCTMSVGSTFRTTGKPSSAAVSPAAAAVRARRAGTTGTPAAATILRADSSLAGTVGRSAGAGTSGRVRRSRKDRAVPARAAVARVAGVASPYIGIPAASRSLV